eukprot:TRINITY_DN12515_c0_g1_i1.p1 TRINITY_DN12515_c0_g1~~TRINITY_DN12515_c0_g1_i1.p1  ORF type:complete len:416 (+),score=138.22 TRINITY_DN12515_c0_g1_i1:396-1643(+)
MDAMMEAEVDVILQKNEMWRRHVAEHATQAQSRLLEVSLLGTYFHAWLQKDFHLVYQKRGASTLQVQVAELNSLLMNKEIEHKDIIKDLKQRHDNDLVLFNNDMQLLKAKLHDITAQVDVEGLAQMKEDAVAATGRLQLTEQELRNKNEYITKLQRENEACKEQLHVMALEHTEHMKRVEASQELLNKISHDRCCSPEPQGHEVARLQRIVKFLGEKTAALQESLQAPNTSVVLLRNKVASCGSDNEKLREEVDTLKGESLQLKETIQSLEVQMGASKSRELQECETLDTFTSFVFASMQERVHIASLESAAWTALVGVHATFLHTKVKRLNSELLSAELSAAQAAAAMTTTTLKTQHLQSLLSTYQAEQNTIPKRKLEDKRGTPPYTQGRASPTPLPQPSYSTQNIEKWNVQWS